MGLAAIYTKYPQKDVDIDIMFIAVGKNNEDHVFERIKQNSNVSNFYIVNSNKFLNIYFKLFKPKNFFNTFNFVFKCGGKIRKIYKECGIKERYSDIFFSHELGYMITFLKFISPKAEFIPYGDGPGGLMGVKTKFLGSVDNEACIDEVKSSRVIALLPHIQDNSIDLTNVPIEATNRDTLLEIIKNDTSVQKDVNEFTDELLKKYKKKNIFVLLSSKLYDERFNLSKDDQINIYIDIIKKHVEPNGILVLKQHPTDEEDLEGILKEKLNSEYELITVSKALRAIPIEAYVKLLLNSKKIISFLSSSYMSIKCLYNIDCENAYEVIQNYEFINCVGPSLKLFEKVVKKIDKWDRKSLILKEDITDSLARFVKNN